MREWTIQVSGFTFLNYQTVEIEKKVGEHATARITGTIAAENARSYVEDHRPGDGVTLTGYDRDGNQRTLLNGMIDKLMVFDRSGVHTLTLELVSWSYLMDIHRHIRTFQDKSMTYRVQVFFGEYLGEARRVLAFKEIAEEKL